MLVLSQNKKKYLLRFSWSIQSLIPELFSINFVQFSHNAYNSIHIANPVSSKTWRRRRTNPLNEKTQQTKKKLEDRFKKTQQLSRLCELSASRFACLCLFFSYFSPRTQKNIKITKCVEPRTLRRDTKENKKTKHMLRVLRSDICQNNRPDRQQKLEWFLVPLQQQISSSVERVSKCTFWRGVWSVFQHVASLFGELCTKQTKLLALDFSCRSRVSV